MAQDQMVWLPPFGVRIIDERVDYLDCQSLEKKEENSINNFWNHTMETLNNEDAMLRVILNDGTNGMWMFIYFFLQRDVIIRK